jgi:glycosyltransferase involved in cell wall biosynthesis
MQPLVSVIIPCFNTERWIAAAIDSCLQQTYPNLEIIVVDDGSTDNSLEIIKSYGKKVIWQSVNHRGGNYARNKGLALSKGKYIQYLDADDYILPNKIERQVSFLEETGADVVYCDWRFRHHLLDGSDFFGEIERPGKQADIIESLLADWWTAVASLLYRRTAVESSGGWDENLKAAQDRDFFLSVVLQGAKVVYQPGCHAVYRRYGNVTVSTRSKPLWIDSHRSVLIKAEQKLKQSDRLFMKYRYALAQCYFDLSREALQMDDYAKYLQLLKEALTVFPEFKRGNGKQVYNFIQSICGFRLTESIICRLLITKKVVDSAILQIQTIHDHWLASQSTSTRKLVQAGENNYPMGKV